MAAAGSNILVFPKGKTARFFYLGRNMVLDHAIGSSAWPSIETRGREKNKDGEKSTRLNEKTLDPVGGTLRFWLDTSFNYLLGENLNQLRKRSLRCALHWW